MVFCGHCKFHKTHWFNGTSICKHNNNKVKMISYKVFEYKNGFCELINKHNDCEYYEEKI